MTRDEMLGEPYEQQHEAHRRYYSQFVTPRMIALVRNNIGERRLKASKDPYYFNDLPLFLWDEMYVPRAQKEVHRIMLDVDPANAKWAWHEVMGTCLLKEAGRLIREGKV